MNTMMRGFLVGFLLIFAGCGKGTSVPGNGGLANIPPAPTGVIAMVENGQVTLSWATTPGATTYNIYGCMVDAGCANKYSGTRFMTYISGLTSTLSFLTENNIYYFSQPGYEKIRCLGMRS